MGGKTEIKYIRVDDNQLFYYFTLIYGDDFLEKIQEMKEKIHHTQRNWDEEKSEWSLVISDESRKHLISIFGDSAKFHLNMIE